MIIQNTEKTSNGHAIATFEGGVLTLDHLPTTNVGDVADRVYGIQKTLEAAL